MHEKCDMHSAPLGAGAARSPAWPPTLSPHARCAENPFLKHRQWSCLRSLSSSLSLATAAKRGIPTSLVGRRQRQYRSGLGPRSFLFCSVDGREGAAVPGRQWGRPSPGARGFCNSALGPAPGRSSGVPGLGRHHRGLHMHRGLIPPLTHRHRVFIIRGSSVYTTSLVRAGSVKRRCALRPPGGSAADSGVRGSGFLVCPDLLAFRQVGMSRCVHSSYYVARPDQPQRSESLDSLSDHP